MCVYVCTRACEEGAAVPEHLFLRNLPLRKKNENTKEKLHVDRRLGLSLPRRRRPTHAVVRGGGGARDNNDNNDDGTGYNARSTLDVFAAESSAPGRPTCPTRASTLVKGVVDRSRV